MTGNAPLCPNTAPIVIAKPVQRRTGRGFTLIELMIAVAVVAILASVAVPSYTDYIRRSRITEATNELATLRVRLEQYFQDHGHYGSTASACGLAVSTTDAFDFGCNDGGGGNRTFVATATGRAAANMSGFSFTIDHDNVRRTTGFPGANDLPVDCWISRAGDSC